MAAGNLANYFVETARAPTVIGMYAPEGRATGASAGSLGGLQLLAVTVTRARRSTPNDPQQR